MALEISHGRGRTTPTKFLGSVFGRTDFSRIFMFVGAENTNHDSQRRDSVLRFFLRRAIFATFWGDSLLHIAQKSRRKRRKIHEKIQKIQWRRRPEIADFCPLSWSNAS